MKNKENPIKKNKKLSALKYADISLQLWRDKNDVINFTVTCNEYKRSKLLFSSEKADCRIFGESLANNHLLDELDHGLLKNIFISYINARKYYEKS